MNIYIYPGSFDPVTNGHLDIIERAADICDRLIVAVGINISKTATFTAEERITMLERVVNSNPKVTVEKFSGLLIDFVRQKDARVIIKGLRALSDFEYEFQMALLNKNLDNSIETMFMMTNVNYSYLSSSAVKELARNGGSIKGLVPEAIRDFIVEKFQK